MKYLIEKLQELTSNIWLKLIAFIPVCFFQITDKEKAALFALIFITSADSVLGAMVAKYVNNNFSPGLFGKKFVKKFSLFAGGLFIAHAVSKGYLEVDFAFYWMMFIVSASEFGSAAEKLEKLGFPVRVRYFTYLNCKIDLMVKNALGIDVNVCEIKKPKKTICIKDMATSKKAS